MKHMTWKWATVAILAGVAIYLGTLFATAQTESKPESADRLEEIVRKLDALTKKVDDVSQKVDEIQKDVSFIKARGKG